MKIEHTLPQCVWFYSRQNIYKNTHYYINGTGLLIPPYMFMVFFLSVYSNWQYWHFQGSVKTNLYCRERGSEATGDRHINSESTMHLLAVACKLDCFYLTDLKNVIMNGLRQIVSYYKFHTGQSQSSGSCWSVSVFVWRSPILHKIHWIETRDQISDPEHSGNMYENL